MALFKSFDVRDLVPNVILSDHVYQAKDSGHCENLLNDEEDPNPEFETPESDGINSPLTGF
jgi:hypothetical protein